MRKKVCPRSIPFFLVCGLFLTVALVPETAHANVLNNFATAVLGILNNVFLRVIAIIAVIVVGITALQGRMEWQRAIWVVVGVVIIFGAAGIVD